MIAFTRDELRVVLGTSIVYALRMVGLYMALPLMATWASGLPGATPFLVGISLGAYGLTQAVFQVPFGILGDLRGRRLVVILSLLVFALGSAVVATGQTIFAVILGRLVQGVGAMASTLIALIGDGTRDAVRTRGMALMGFVLGLSFALGFLLGPLVSSRFGVPAVFGAACVLSLAGVLLFEFLVPSRLLPHIVRGSRPRPGAPGSWSWTEARSLFKDRSLLVLDAGIFVMHAAVTGLFVVVPFVLRDRGVADLDLWRVYAPVLAAGLVAMVIASRLADRAALGRLVLAVGVGLIVTGLIVLSALHHSVPWITLGLGLFVVGFASIEPLLAALLTRYTGRGARGTAAGLFNMIQFSGAFLGGSLSGLLLPLGRGVPLLVLAAGVLGWGFALRALRDPADLVDSSLAADGLDEETWARVHRSLVAHGAVLEADWAPGSTLRVRHWPDRVTIPELESLVTGAARGWQGEEGRVSSIS
ncbi:MAG: MFS transporter [Candidatus Eisenbacteria bacterium]